MGQVFCCVQVNQSTVNIKDKGMGQVFCFVKVDHSKVTIKENIDKSEEAMEQPGCLCLSWICGSKLHGLQQLNVLCDTKTKDNVSVDVVAKVLYRASADKASDPLYKTSNARSQIQAYVFDVIGASIPKLSLDDAFEKKNEIAKAVEEELKKSISVYGYEIVQTLIVDIKPDDEHVKQPMNDEINANLKEATNEKVEAQKISQIKPAEGEVGTTYLSRVSIGR